MSESSLSALPVYSGRPTLRIAGQDEPRAGQQLLAMTMDEREGGLSALELRLLNWVATSGGPPELGFDAGSRLRLGVELAVYAGDETSPTEIFKGRVSALELHCRAGEPPELVVLAEDALTAARRARRSAVYADLSPADVVRRIAGELGLTPVLSGLDAPVATWVQLDETDLQFLRRLLGRFDSDLQVVGSELHVSPRQAVARGVVELALHSQLAEVRVTADLAEQATAVTVAGWNAVDGRAVSAAASSLVNAGPGQGRSGLAWASEVFGTRSEHLAAPLVASDDEARAVAEAALDQRARRFLRADGVAEGNPVLRVGSTVRLSGLSPQFDNSYYVVRTRHRFDLRHGYRTEFGAECAYLAD